MDIASGCRLLSHAFPALRFGMGLVVLACLLTGSAWAADCPKSHNLPLSHEGMMGYDKASKNVYMCNGTAWVALAAGNFGPQGGGNSGTGITTPSLEIYDPADPTHHHCLPGLSYRSGYGCCVVLSINLSPLQILYGVTLQICPF